MILGVTHQGHCMGLTDICVLVSILMVFSVCRQNHSFLGWNCIQKPSALWITKQNSNMLSFIECRWRARGLIHRCYFKWNLQEDPSWTDTMLQLCLGSQRVKPFFFIKMSLINVMKAGRPQESTCWRMHACLWEKNTIWSVKTWINVPQFIGLLLWRQHPLNFLKGEMSDKNLSWQHMCF